MPVRDRIKYINYNQKQYGLQPVVKCKSTSTIGGSIKLPSDLTTIDVELSKCIGETGVRYLPVLDIGVTGTTLFYTGLNDTIDYTFNASGVTGIAHGQYYGIKFMTNQGLSLPNEKHTANIVVQIEDEVK